MALRHPELPEQVRRTRRSWHLQRHVLGPLRALRHGRRADLLELLAEALGGRQGARAYREQLALSPAEGRVPTAEAA